MDEKEPALAIKKIFFLCHGILPDSNRTQFNRTRFLCSNYDVTIVAASSVSFQAVQKARAVFVFPFKEKILKIFFPFWAFWTVLKLSLTHRKFKYIYSTYEPRTLVLGFSFSKVFQLKWIADLWDDPEKMVLLTRIHRTKFHALNLVLKKIEFSLASKILKKADKIILGVVPERIILKYALFQNDMLAITNGINLEYRFFGKLKKNTFHPEALRLFYCGPVDSVRLEGIAPCIRAMLEQIPRIRFVVAGPEVGCGYQWLKKNIDGFKENVCLDIRGYEPYDVVLNLISGSDVCICPYPDQLDLASAYPVKIFDYMVMGKPVVASRLAGIESILTHGNDSLLFEAGNYQEMAEHIIRLWRSPDLRNRITANARANVQKYNWDLIHRQIFEFLDEKMKTMQFLHSK